MENRDNRKQIISTRCCGVTMGTAVALGGAMQCGLVLFGLGEGTESEQQLPRESLEAFECKERHWLSNEKKSCWPNSGKRVCWWSHNNPRSYKWVNRLLSYTRKQTPHEATWWKNNPPWSSKSLESFNSYLQHWLRLHVKWLWPRAKSCSPKTPNKPSEDEITRARRLCTDIKGPWGRRFSSTQGQDVSSRSWPYCSSQNSCLKADPSLLTITLTIRPKVTL